MPSDAVKIVYGTTTLLFSCDEVLDSTLSESQDYQVQRKQASEPAINYVGSIVHGIKITFDLQRKDTLDKIDQFLESGEELTVYYSQQYDDTAHLHVVPLRDGMEEVETFGNIEAVTRTITFVKTAA